MLCKEILLAPRGAATQATLKTYFLENESCIDPDRTRPVVIVCPGGGYHFVSPREAEPVALQFNAMGCHAAVLNYAVAPAHWPDASLQLAMGIAHVRAHAAEYHIDPHKVVVAGFSAGGHLAATAGTLWNDAALYGALGEEPRAIRPDAMILSYPVITCGDFAHQRSFSYLTTGTLTQRDAALCEKLSLETRVTADTPPTFLWHTADDANVPVENSVLFFSALHRCGVPAELHIFPHGYHGLSLATPETKRAEGNGTQPECAQWIELARRWLDATLGIYSDK